MYLIKLKQFFCLKVWTHFLNQRTCLLSPLGIYIYVKVRLVLLAVVGEGSLPGAAQMASTTRSVRPFSF